MTGEPIGDRTTTLDWKLYVYQAALAEVMRLWYGEEPKDVWSVAQGYAEMRRNRLEMDEELGPPANGPGPR
jgi:hypothetical protein